MIEVDNIRRNFNIGPYEPSFMSQAHPLTGTAPVSISGYDRHRVLVHWNQPPGLQQNTQHIPPPSGPTTPATKSDEEDDDDDEDRPFTPPPPRERLSYTRYQLELLNGIYEEVRYPNSTQKQLIAKRVGITREQVKIWFQNRRRKDVIGNSGKSKGDKSCDTSNSSMNSTGSSKDYDSQQNSPALDVVDNESSSSDENTSNSSPTESPEQVVPSLVMKSVIDELVKFKEDPLKGKKNRKKKKKSNKKKEQEIIKKGLVSTLISGSYDMINPPNQITPTAFFEKVKMGFNHSKSASAFASPRDVTKPAQISRISSTSESPPVSSSTGEFKQMTPGIMTNSAFPFGSSPANFLSPDIGSHYQTSSNNHNCEIPVLSELLTYKSGLQTNKQPVSTGSSSHSPSSALPTSPLDRRAPDRQHFPPHPGMVPFPPVRPFNGIYPYPFLAEQPMVLSSLRQPDHIFRTAPQYPMSSFSDDPYQPLLITSLSNPYYSPPSTWQTTSSSTQQQTSYTSL
ncbi:sequence-specific DNA binding [Mactra antiquata]